MTRMLSFALGALLLLAAPVVAADSEGRISGRLLEIRPDGKLVIEEQGPWQGPGTGVVTRMLELTPGTSIQVVHPTGQWEPSKSTPGYEVHSADFTVLRTGDFVTVRTAGDRSTIAVSLEVMRPDGADAGLAAPRLGSGR